MAADNGYETFLPPLSSAEFEALRADIQANGVLHAVVVDEEGNVLDGRHRLKIDPKAPRKVIRGLSPAEKEAFVFRCNFMRRNLSPEQKREAHTRMKATASRLREEDARKWTQKRVAAALGVAQQTVSDWFGEQRTTNTGSGNACALPDARVKIAPAARPAVVAAIDAGMTQEQVAADLGVTQQTVSRIVNAERKQEAAKRERRAAAKRIKTSCGIEHGNLEALGEAVADATVDLILTDPPYDADAIKLYGKIAALGARVLRPGGWCLAYCGQAHLPETLDAMRHGGLTYGWTFAVIHSGGDLRFRKFKLQNGWKPVLGFYRPPLDAAWDWFPDTVSGGREKDLHEWQQAEGEAEHFVRALSVSGGLVLDPCCGSGTTLVAAKKLRRKWLGFERDGDHVATARERLA